MQNKCQCTSEMCPIERMLKPTIEQIRIATDIANNGEIYCKGLVTAGLLTEEERADLLALNTCITKAKSRKEQRVAAKTAITIAIRMTRAATLHMQQLKVQKCT